MRGKKSIKNIEQGASAAAKTIAKSRQLKKIAEKIQQLSVDKIYTVGCGSSYWLGFLLCEFLRDGHIDCQPVQASEFYFDNYPINDKTLVIGFSQSGETTETIKAIKKAKKNKAVTFTIINQAGSTMSCLSDHSFVTPAGKENILATKSFDAALTASYIFAAALNNELHINFEIIPSALNQANNIQVDKAVKLFLGEERAYTLGIDRDYGVAGEAAVKLGEAALIETLAMPALEISHGPKANVAGIPVILFANQNEYLDLYENLIEELTQAGAKIMVLSSLQKKIKSVLTINFPADKELSAFASIKIIQRLAVAIAIAKGLEPDQPPTLKKFVKRKM